MDTKRSCFRCGIEVVWRIGPLEKPALCNVCRSKDAQRNQGPSFTFGSSAVGHDQLPFVFSSGVYPGSGSRIAVSQNNTQTQNAKANNKISRKKRSTFDQQQVLSPTERLHQQLYIAMEEQSNDDEKDPESLLIFERINKYIPENEIGLGCMLLKPPPSLDGDSKKESIAKSHQAKDSELLMKNNPSFPTEESYEDDTSSKFETLAISTQSTGEPRNNIPRHPMVTRSKGKNRDSDMLLKDIGGSGSYGDVEVTLPYKRTRGRPRKSQGEIPFSGQGKMEKSMLSQNESKIDQLTNNLNDGLNIRATNLTDDENMQTVEVDERKTSGTLGIKPFGN